MILVSIIIPIYNKEKYLESCLNSIVNQTYKNIEIILIDDGSTDNSSDIIKEKVLRDTRIKYYSQDNKGVANTRNRGIEIATGEYIFFQDADDLLEEDTIFKLINNVRLTNADIVLANFLYKKENEIMSTTNIQRQFLNGEKLILSQIKADLFLLNGRPMSSVCNKLYNRDFLIKYNVKFRNKIHAEDRLFNLECYIKSPTISIIEEKTYIVRLVEDSRSRKLNENYYSETINLEHSLHNTLFIEKKLSHNIDLLQFSLIFDLDKILDYYYRYTNNRFKSISGIIKCLKADNLINKIIKSIHEQKPLKNINGNSHYFKRVHLFSSLISSTPTFLFTFIYISYRLVLSFRQRLNNIIN